MSIEAELTRFIEDALGERVRELRPIAAGLGSRRFFRVTLAGGTVASVIARVDGERERGSGPEPAMEPLRHFLAGAAYPVPARYGGGRLGARGPKVELLEDLGDQSLERAARGADREQLRSWYVEACSLPPRLQRLQEPVTELDAFRRHLIDFLPIKEARFAQLGLPTLLERPATKAERASLADGFALIAECVADAPERLAHRDFQSSNLILTDAGIVTIDFQGAFLAPPEYDLVCLLRDSYVELPDGWARDLALTTRPLLPDAPEETLFLERFDLLTLARKTKDYAFFCDAVARGDMRFAGARRLTLRYLQEAAERASQRGTCFAVWREWFERGSKESGRDG